MSEMAPERPTPEWHSEPAPCPHRDCRHSWHALPCVDCFCETSCLAPTLIIPSNICLGAE
jgi:hypothetical protein